MLQPLARPFHLVLVSPQIPPNTGNIARLCAVTGCRLILVEPLGFSIDDRHLKRAGLDYWDKVFLKLYPDYGAYLAEWPSARRWLFSARAATSLYAARLEEGDHLVFGSETQGLPPEVMTGGSGTAVTLPMLPERRSLNLSTAVGIAAYEALRQVGFGLPGGRADTPS
ncbi:MULTISPECIES: tRNA (cytidine(34)-2'-O)-methyltransferase [Cystobacter]|jgi:tRNA (cytidine/uridine-2'-O-)-methyltransferase|uniref:Putative tRNA (cytidine(34)-2'-O)-methyltransferase n=3 Tax=Cystobacter TaxID=42 RepID=A0A1L9AXE9_9BACT|nr:MULTISPECIES: tRNA (cytidine(34)-2'-O)-methyltransferase [Cystobacter]ATB42274.1 tRNA (cytosine34-2'-O-)-methyltransferase [Cystobacter fuscus]EPX62896.1 tRNA (cytosine34-2'-O-)-methyltransferase [Cystobacter fuscus DSM 2262]OJH34691.1 tRNA (uridine(34)/cytosine(34)/5-carboxymethylaminomethyluridine(34)-2'-O)-methyltransferase TrmL [Cystobacter ferrugineus]WNG19834.1 tRNA (cytidine(34)-2'-O)-methyltransferase [Cystobacter fuscus]WNG29398.1 tRNA (cytidine(34)-2'-O)-methyltransferase [Cystoba